MAKKVTNSKRIAERCPLNCDGHRYTFQQIAYPTQDYTAVGRLKTVGAVRIIQACTCGHVAVSAV